MKKRYLFISMVFVLLLVVTSCGNKSDSEADTPKGCISGSDLPAAFQSPNDYKGYDVEMIVNVFSVESDDSMVVFQGWQDYLNNKNNTVVSIEGKADVKENDYVKVKGKIVGEFVGENLIGEKVTALQVKAETIEKMSYKDIFAPTLKKLQVNQTKKQKGYSVTVDKVEFAKNETRIYVIIANNGKSEFNLYTFDAKIKQGKKQYESHVNYEADYEELPSELIQDTEASGVIVFPAIAQSDFTLILKASSDDFNENIKDYKFSIAVF